MHLLFLYPVHLGPSLLIFFSTPTPMKIAINVYKHTNELLKIQMRPRVLGTALAECAPAIRQRENTAGRFRQRLRISRPHQMAVPHLAYQLKLRMALSRKADGG